LRARRVDARYDASKDDTEIDWRAKLFMDVSVIHVVGNGVTCKAPRFNHRPDHRTSIGVSGRSVTIFSHASNAKDFNRWEGRKRR